MMTSDHVNDSPQALPATMPLNQPSNPQATNSNASDATNALNTSHAQETLSTTPAPEAVSFLNLPTEIRNVIYKEYFHGLYVTIERLHRTGTYDGTVNGVPEPDFSWSRRNNTIVEKDIWAFLTSCKTIAFEALPVLCGSATFVFLDPVSFVSCSNNMLIQGLPLRLPNHPGGSFNAFDHIKRVWLDLTELGDKPELPEPQRRSRAAAICEIETPLLHNLTHYLPALKHLNITVKLECNLFHNGSGLDPIRKQPLAALCTLNNLENFSLALQRPLSISWGPNAYESANERIRVLNAVLAKHVEKNTWDDTPAFRLNHDNCNSTILQLRVVNEIYYFFGRHMTYSGARNIIEWKLALEDNLVRQLANRR